MRTLQRKAAEERKEANAVLDEALLTALDWTIEKLSGFFAPWAIRIRRSIIGYRPTLIKRGVCSGIRNLVGKVVSASQGDGPFQSLMPKEEAAGEGAAQKKEETPGETPDGEKKDDAKEKEKKENLFVRLARWALMRFYHWRVRRKKQREKNKARRQKEHSERLEHRAQRRAAIDRTLCAAQEALSRGMFAYLLLMTLLCACLLAAKGTRELAVLSAFFCLNWAAEAMHCGYEPLCAGVRQRYLAAVLLRGFSYLALLLSYFFAYSSDLISSNVLLQATMALTGIVHLAMFFSFVAFNRRQQLFLRVLAGVMGIAPALACAAGTALGVATAAKALNVAAGGILRAAGICLAFLCEQVNMISALGGNRLRFGRLWGGTMMAIGFFMMLGGAWLCAL